MKYVWTLDDIEPYEFPEKMGHYGGTGWPLINAKTVGAETIRVHHSVYPPGSYTEGHPIHTDREQVYYIVSGTMSLTIGGEHHEVPPGAYVFIPRGIEHNQRNDGSEDLVVVTINCPIREGEIVSWPERE